VDSWRFESRADETESQIVDPPNGRLPPVTPETQKLAAAERAFRVACCNRPRHATEVSTHSPRFKELPPRYNTARMNRHYGPSPSASRPSCKPYPGAKTAGDYKK
jgi:hypothetical protein